MFEALQLGVALEGQRFKRLVKGFSTSIVNVKGWMHELSRSL